MATFRSAGDLKSGKQCGVGSAAQHSKYLLREYSTDKNGNKHPRFTDEIAGDLHQLVLITNDVMKAKYRFIPATIGFTQEESDRLSDEAIRKIALNYAEHLASPVGLESVPFSVQKHTSIETGRVDVHVTLARYDLQTGKTFQPYVETREPRASRPQYGDSKRLKVFQAIQTLKYHLDDPNDPMRIRWTKDRDGLPKHNKERIIAINQYVDAYVKCGSIKNREDVLALLHTMGFSTPRAGVDYITVKRPDWKRGVRLKGAAYKVSFAGFIEPVEPKQSDAERLAELQQQMDEIDKHRLPYFEKHFRQSKAINQNTKQDQPDHAPVLATPDTVNDQQYFNTSHPTSCRSPKKRTAASIEVSSKHVEHKPSPPNLNIGSLNQSHQIRIIDLCVFDSDLQIWAYRAFPHIFVTDLGNRIMHHGTESEWKLAAALATEKGWEAVRLDCSDMESAKRAIKHHRIFGIEITAITINSKDGKAELSEHELNQLLEKDDEQRNGTIESKGVCDDGGKYGGNIRGDGADTERQQRVGNIRGRIADDCRGLRKGQQRSEKENADLSKAVIAVDEVSANIERWGMSGNK